MQKKILITGGAGFIGSHLTDELLSHGYSVRILDNLSEQIHGKLRQRPEYLTRDAQLIIGDVRNPSDIKRALEGIDIVYHFAASVGVGQSMYMIKDYMEVNTLGTSVLLQYLIDNPVEKLVIASSMSIYGEGYYQNATGEIVEGYYRSLGHLKDANWELYDNEGYILKPVPTSETKHPSLASVYALSKYDQEQLCLMIGNAYNIPTIALRFFNVYGTRQALSNPYTGVLAIFASRLLNNKPPLIFEDGLQKRDFVHVKDVARACRQAIEAKGAENNVYNIGSGNFYSIKEIANQLSWIMGKEDIKPEITNKYRAGDIRHCYSDITKAKEKLDYHPVITLQDGLTEYILWLQSQIASDYVEKAHEELSARGLAI